MYTLAILTGPSCVGKSPLLKAARDLYPEALEPYEKVVLYTSRSPRPGEIDGKDYYFRPRNTIDKLAHGEHIRAFEVRGDLQAIDVEELQKNLQHSPLIFEGNPYAARLIAQTAADFDISVHSLFLSPVNQEEFSGLMDMQSISAAGVITEMMRRKLLRRTRAQKGNLSLEDLQMVERRAGAAFEEIRMAPQFDYVLPNHDGEDSEHWEALSFLFGDARKAVRAFVQLLDGKQSAPIETWSESLFTGKDLV
ncbi:MAG: hypothetical protein ACOC41_09310 [Chitinivibrionales bacterium]